MFIPAFYFRNGNNLWCWKDHTLSALLQDDRIPGNQLANCFGGNAKEVFCDFDEMTDRVTGGDILFLCSDGVTGEMSNEDIEKCLQVGPVQPHSWPTVAKRARATTSPACRS